MLNEAYTFYRPGKDITCKAGAALTGKRLCVISANRSGGGIATITPTNTSDLQNNYVVNLPAAGGTVFGVVGWDVAIGLSFPVKRGGILSVTASGAIAAWGEVEVLADGRIKALAGGNPVGRVLTAVADGADAEFMMYGSGGGGGTELVATTKPVALTDSTGGVAAATLVLPRSDTTAHLAADVAANEASLNAQINALIAALVASGALK